MPVVVVDGLYGVDGQVEGNLFDTLQISLYRGNVGVQCHVEMNPRFPDGRLCQAQRVFNGQVDLHGTGVPDIGLPGEVFQITHDLCDPIGCQFNIRQDLPEIFFKISVGEPPESLFR